MSIAFPIEDVSRLSHAAVRRSPRIDNDEDRDELAQEVIMRVWKNWHLFDPDRGKLSTWIFTIAKRIIDRWRNRKGRLKCALAGEHSAWMFSTRDSERVEISPCLFNGLSKIRRELVYFYYQREWSLEQIAAHFGMNYRTVKSQLWHARNKMRETLNAA